MTKISLLAAVLAVLAVPACKRKEADQPAPAKSETSAPAPTPSPKPTEAPKPKTAQELVEMYKGCADKLNSGKLDDFVKDCIDDSYAGHMGPQSMTKGDLKGMFTAMRTAFPDFKWAPQIVLVSGHNIFGVALVTGTHEGPMKMPGMPELPATHKKIGQLVAHKLAITDDGKAKEEWAFGDDGTMTAQLGLAPKEAPPKRPAMDKGIDGTPIVVIAADDAKERTNVETVKKSNDAFNAHKTADVLALLTDDAVESDEASAKDNVGKKEIEKGLKEFLTAFSDAKVDGDVWGAGDYVVTIGKFEATNDHDMGKMKKTGKHVSVAFTELDQVKDGKISHMWRFYNSIEFATQLGLLPPPGAAPAGADAKAGDKKPDAPPKK